MPSASEFVFVFVSESLRVPTGRNKKPTTVRGFWENGKGKRKKNLTYARVLGCIGEISLCAPAVIVCVSSRYVAKRFDEVRLHLVDKQ